MIDLQINITGRVQLRGFYRLVVTDQEGKITKDSGLMPNLVTDQGLDFFGTCTPEATSSRNAAFANSCAVGTGNTAPTNSDTVLVNQLAMLNASDGGVMSGNTYTAGPPAYYQGQRSWQFAAGTATGNIAEIGVGPYYSGISSLPLFSRALVVDSGGSPTVIPVLSTEALTVTYIFQLYTDLTDHAYTMSLSGTSYSGIWRLANCTTPPSQLGVGSQMGSFTNPILYVFNGTIGSTSSSPGGSSSYVGITKITTYTPGSYFRGYTGSYTINQGNLSGGITAILWNLGIVPNYQMSVSPAIPKTASYNMTLNANISWSRYP